MRVALPRLDETKELEGEVAVTGYLSFVYRYCTVQHCAATQ